MTSSDQASRSEVSDALSMPSLRVCAPTPPGFSQCGLCGASAQDRRLAIFDLRFKLSLHGADSGACSPASCSSALASSRVCLGRSRGLAAGAQAARAARYMGRKTCWGSETGYYYLRHATHRLAPCSSIYPLYPVYPCALDMPSLAHMPLYPFGGVNELLPQGQSCEKPGLRPKPELVISADAI